ncbi:hypothetical protein BATDEDRAFT_13423 [Batrachochytrium dendrobatidis JAM81]|uniref:AMP-dependent synthetase/ligase domain-containing protein n=1 Tax=Batrachochytrium dendrobatidis (strain JAM81 / FGSC 10211) TaxID=684364 RepID=F4P935_BATDJ|nr:uncharacterized protein BATDEDRAFT_13423 [Batrachochytrium dendrobatidis JAM81]EGF78111.1 hypothetical protein BATDEDRAFT_13423 [Batrachochytrium dendrobatidis JAM81]|eukprot:XP_006681006.1 hypothetical protein BATDEDRAFT_13423 [Batrachochytrium dendrobatidis JAM81]
MSHPFNNLVEILSDSFSPAVILTENTQDSSTNKPSYCKLYYSQLRTHIQHLQQQEPFSHLQPGTAVTFLLSNSYEYITVFFAILAQRAVANPLNPNYTVDEILFYLQDVQPSVVVVAKDAANVETVKQAASKANIPVYELSMQVVAVHSKVTSTNSQSHKLKLSNLRQTYSLDDVALFLHTSGTTGRPKGVPLTHRGILASMRNIVDAYKLQPTDLSYLVMPLFHVHGLIGVTLSTMLSGGTVIVPPKFSPKRFWVDVVGLGATWYSAVPTIHQMLLITANETYLEHNGKLRFIRSCSSSLAPATMLELEQRFHAPVIEAYAMTEASHQMTANFLPPGIRKPGSVGKGRGVNVRILDDNGKELSGTAVGEVCVSGPNLFTGYHNNPKATAESFHIDSKHQRWFRTGDLGRMDENRFVVLVGRIKEQINRGGEKISPVEIDQVLLQHPAVAEVVTFGSPSKLYGQEIEAAVVLKKTGNENKVTTEEDLKVFARKSLAAFKVPCKIHIVDTIPKTATGKVQRRVVSDHFQSLALHAKL